MSSFPCSHCSPEVRELCQFVCPYSNSDTEDITLAVVNEDGSRDEPYHGSIRPPDLENKSKKSTGKKHHQE